MAKWNLQKILAWKCTVWIFGPLLFLARRSIFSQNLATSIPKKVFSMVKHWLYELYKLLVNDRAWKKDKITILNYVTHRGSIMVATKRRENSRKMNFRGGFWSPALMITPISLTFMSTHLMINSKNQKNPSNFEGGPGKSKSKTQLLRKRVICLADFWAPPLHLRWHFSWKVWENLYTLQTFWKKLVICSCFYQKSIFLRRKSQKMTGRTSYYVFLTFSARPIWLPRVMLLIFLTFWHY